VAQCFSTADWECLLYVGLQPLREAETAEDRDGAGCRPSAAKAVGTGGGLNAAVNRCATQKLLMRALWFPCLKNRETWGTPFCDAF